MLTLGGGGYQGVDVKMQQEEDQKDAGVQSTSNGIY